MNAMPDYNAMSDDSFHRDEIDGVEADILTSFYYARPGTIVGGSSEIQRNILARYVLQLPVG